MKYTISLFSIVLILVSILCIGVSWSMYNQLKRKELEFGKEKALMIKEKLDIEDSLIVLQQTIKQNNTVISSLEKENIFLTSNVKQLEEETEKTVSVFTEQLEKLQQENTILAKESEALKKNPIIQRILTTLQGDKTQLVQQALENLLQNLEAIKAGRLVNLAPIDIIETSAATALQTSPSIPPGKRGEILSVDEKYTLIIINLGRRNQITTGDRCLIVKSGQEIATSEIISVRYRVAAAVIDGLNTGFSLNDVQKGCSVVVKE